MPGVLLLPGTLPVLPLRHIPDPVEEAPTLCLPTVSARPQSPTQAPQGQRPPDPDCSSVNRLGPKLFVTITDLGFFCLRYTVNLGEDTLSLLGCSHMCKKEIEEKKCCPGFWGTECYECPGGPEKPCSGHGTCLDGITRNGTCTCEVSTGCTVRKCHYVLVWVSLAVCECQHGVCNHGISGDGSCTCHGGYTGPKCDQGKCVACGNKRLGYAPLSSLCLRIAQDPCTSSPCSSLAVCKALSPEKYECTCKDGYHGDGKICQPINPCIINNGGCPENTTVCIYKSPGTATCQCNKGWTGDGKACVAIDNCVLETRGDCHMNADCSFIGPGQVKHTFPLSCKGELRIHGFTGSLPTLSTSRVSDLTLLTIVFLAI
uniref:Stabilin 1 n=1 Tax=Chelonoidis abingdonii TaxID=106734 RepID=A0A8C0ITZ8_CHEAB